MGYLEKRVQYRTDNKKIASARVSEVVMAALSDASKDADIHGYSFTISRIIEKALNDTLAELKGKTFIDYYQLVDWKRRMEQVQTVLSFDGLTHFFDFDKELTKYKLALIADESVITSEIGMGGNVDLILDDSLSSLNNRIIQKWNDNLTELNIDLAVTNEGQIYQPLKK
jgi:hypothetical protein